MEETINGIEIGAKIDNSRLIASIRERFGRRATETTLLCPGRGFLVLKDVARGEIVTGKKVPNVGSKGTKEAYNIRFESLGDPNLRVIEGRDLISSYGQKNDVVIYDDGSAELVEYRSGNLIFGHVGETDLVEILEFNDDQTKVAKHISPLTQKLSCALADVVERAESYSYLL